MYMYVCMYMYVETRVNRGKLAQIWPFFFYVLELFLGSILTLCMHWFIDFTILCDL